MNRIATTAIIVLILSACGNPQLNKGVAAYKEMAYADAINHLELALKKDSTNAKAKLTLADAYRLTNDYKNAEAMYADVVQLSESEPRHKLEYARILMSANKHDEAANMIRLYLQDKPDDKVAKSLLEACNYIIIQRRYCRVYPVTNTTILQCFND